MKQRNITYKEIVAQFSTKKVLVIGDFILDVYLKGNSTRLCPEAPVPVVDIHTRDVFAGGAANTACNLKSLGADVTFCTVIGTDREGDEAMQVLHGLGLASPAVIREQGRKTIIKTRIMSGGHAITRFDIGTTDPITSLSQEGLLAFIRSCHADYDAVFLSDYDKGIIGREMLRCIAELQQHSSAMLVVDSKRLEFFSALRPDLVKPNYDEAIRLTGDGYQSRNRISQIRNLAPVLDRKINASVIAVSMDEEGSVIIKDGEYVHRCFAHPVNNPQVSGAGDTYLSAFTLASLVSGDLKMSGEIATAAASIAVKKESTSVCLPDELVGYFDVGTKLVSSSEQLARICADLHQANKRIIFTNGCFDILHSGHVTYLHCAKKMGDVLIVGLNNDDSIRRLKGSDRPINPLTDRLQVIAGLGSVDYVVPFGALGNDTPVDLIRVIQPHIFAKGGDYSKERLPEAPVVEQLGGEIIFVPYVAEKSTTNIIRQIGSINDIPVKAKAGVI